jgi:hypothetical protein
MASVKAYKIRKFQNGRNRTTGDPYVNYSLTIPTEIAEMLPEEMRYECELTPDGILFRPVESEEAKVTLPAWAQNGNKPKTTRPRPTPKT